MRGPIKTAGSLLIAPVLLNLLFASALRAQFGMQEDLALYERKAALSKELGATHMSVTGGLPLATWEMDPGDPYPMWPQGSVERERAGSAAGGVLHGAS